MPVTGDPPSGNTQARVVHSPTLRRGGTLLAQGTQRRTIADSTRPFEASIRLQLQVAGGLW